MLQCPTKHTKAGDRCCSSVTLAGHHEWLHAVDSWGSLGLGFEVDWPKLQGCGLGDFRLDLHDVV